MARRVKLGMEKQYEEAIAATGTYAGRTPPPGLYRCLIESVKFNEENRNGDPYYTVRFTIAHDPGAPKAVFNGYSRTGNITMNDAQMRYTKQFGQAVGLTTREINNPLVGDDDAVEKFGNKVIDGTMIKVGFNNGRPYNGRRALDPRTYMEDPGEIEGDEPDQIEDDEDIEYSDADAPEDEYDADVYTGDEAEPEFEDDDNPDAEDMAADADAEEGEGDEYEDEPEETPAPRARKAVKAPPARPAAKVAVKKAPAKAARKPF